MYSASEDFSNILIIGNLVAGLKNGKQVDTEFIAQIDLEEVREGKPRAKLYKVWGVSGIAIPCFLSDTGLISNRIVHHGSKLCLNRSFTYQESLEKWGSSVAIIKLKSKCTITSFIISSISI